MADVKIKSQIRLGLKDILEGISQLEISDIEVFLKEVSQILSQKKREANSQSKEEKLLNQLNNNYPVELSQRYNRLKIKAEKEKLTDQEHKELIALSDQFEVLDAQRLQFLLELSKLRNQPLPLLLKEFSSHLPPSAHA